MDRRNIILVATLVSLLIPVRFGLTQLFAAEDTDIKAKRIAVIQFTESFTPMSEQYLYRKLDAAAKEGVGLIVIEIDSGGGRIDVMDRMIERIQSSPIKVVSYVPRQALSAAAIFSLACEEVVIGPQALFGDAGPIIMDEGFMFRHAPEKIRSHLAEQVRTLAESKGRPPALAEAMIDMDLVVFKVKSKDDGAITYLSEAEIESSENPDDWEKLNPVHESREKHFLEVRGKRAVELGLAEVTIDSRNELKQRYGSEEILVLEKTQVDSWVSILNQPIVTGLLFLIGLVALYIEFASPGIGIGGLISIVCFALFFWSRFFGGTAEWLEVVLFIAGLALMIVELFIIPGFGVWGLSGLLLLATSLVMASHDFLIPQDGQQWSDLTTSVGVFLGSMVGFIIAAIFITSKIGSVPVLNRLALKPPESSSDNKENDAQPVHLGVRIGDVGIADSPLRPAGKVRFGDEHIDVISEGSFVDSDTKVRVIDIRGNNVVVRPVT